ncbi:MAG: F0F1 ATP synthase subunit epsilon [Gemmatimonadetes bacterium]|jgi:F-type H+-transporting ATPase subunit epsilon|nr:F0F1 ATP synthase subunit epsilon [Gemmatimonadota bacterium]
MAAPAGATGGDALRVSVISPERTVYEGAADSVVAPAWDGELGIMRGHAPLMALLGEGQLRIRRGGATERFHVAGGFLQVIDNRVTVLSERAEVA